MVGATSQLNMESSTDSPISSTPILYYKDKGFVYTRTIAQGILATFGLAMNCVAVFIIVTKDKPMSPQNRLLLNLFILNWFFCGFVLPIHIADLAYGMDNDWGLFCDIQGYLFVYVQCSTFFAYLHITLHRYFVVVFVQSSMKNLGYTSPLKIGLIVGMCTLIPGVMMLPGLLGVWGKFGLEPQYATCNVIEEQNGGDTSFILFGNAVAIGLPFIVMVYCYGHIIYTVRKQRKKIAPSMPSTSTNPTEPKAKTTKASSKDMRLTLATVMIIIVYFISFMPQLLVELLDSFDVIIVRSLSGPLVMTHVVTDPAIYFSFDRKLKGHLKQLLKCSN